MQTIFVCLFWLNSFSFCFVFYCIEGCKTACWHSISYDRRYPKTGMSRISRIQGLGCRLQSVLDPAWHKFAFIETVFAHSKEFCLSSWKQTSHLPSWQLSIRWSRANSKACFSILSRLGRLTSWLVKLCRLIWTRALYPQFCKCKDVHTCTPFTYRAHTHADPLPYTWLYNPYLPCFKGHASSAFLLCFCSFWVPLCLGPHKAEGATLCCWRSNSGAGVNVSCWPFSSAASSSS